MVAFLWQASRGFRLTPWRSPYLRWRIETYWGLHASHIGFSDFFAFLWSRKRDMIRFLRWAEWMRARFLAH